MTVRHTLRRFQSGAQDRACIIDALQIFQRPRLVVVRVAVARVSGNGLVVPTKRLLVPPGACVLLRYSVHAERVARLTGVQFQELRKARRGGGVVLPWVHTRQTITSGYAAQMRSLLARSALISLVAIGFAAVLSSCAPQYINEDRTDRREKELRIQQHTGGTHHSTVVDNGRWFQTFGNELLTIDTTNGRELGRADGVVFGEGGSLVDLVVSGDSAWAISDLTSLITFDVSDNSDPKRLSAISAEELGIQPRLVSRVGNEMYVSGKGGAVRVSDRKRFLEGESPVHIVASAGGPVTCTGRKIVSLEDGRYLGAASALLPMPPGVGSPGGFAFLLQGKNGASVGVMSAVFSETDQAAIPARVRRIRMCGDRLFAVTDKLLFTWRVDGLKLVDPEEIPLKGGRDIDLIRPNHYAVAGTFGRAMYRHRSEDRRIGDTFYNVERQPGLLEVAVTDGRRVLAGGREGFWLWRIGGEPALTDKTTDLTTIMGAERSAAWGSAHIVEEKNADGISVGTCVEIKHDGAVERYEPDGSPHITAIEFIDGDLWVGHELGLDVLRREEVLEPEDAEVNAASAQGTTSAAKKAQLDENGKPLRQFVGKISPIRSWRFEGPVLFIYPERLGGGGSIVSLHGGFMLLKQTAIGDTPVFTGRGEVQ